MSPSWAPALLVLAGSLVALAVYLGCFAQRGRRR